MMCRRLHVAFFGLALSLGAASSAAEAAPIALGPEGQIYLCTGSELQLLDGRGPTPLQVENCDPQPLRNAAPLGEDLLLSFGETLAPRPLAPFATGALTLGQFAF